MKQLNLIWQKNVYSSRCQHWWSFPPFCVTWRSDGALGKNVNVYGQRSFAVSGPSTQLKKIDIWQL